jgi:hypothetical protein
MAALGLSSAYAQPAAPQRCWMGVVSNTFVRVCATTGQGSVSGIVYAEYENRSGFRVPRENSPYSFNSPMAVDGTFKIGRAYDSMRMTPEGRLVGFYQVEAGGPRMPVNLGPEAAR